jgi:winged helix-turn helix protein
MSDEIVNRDETDGEGDLADLMAGLTPSQQLVLQQLATGANITEAARETGVGRRTVYRWMKDDEKFEAAFNEWRRGLLRLGRARALGMSEAALDTVRGAIEKGNASVALQVAKSLGLFAQGKVGPEEPGEVVMKRARDAKGKKVRIARKERALTEEIGETAEAAESIYEIDELIEQLMLKRMKALREESPQEKVARETNQRVLRKGEERLERIARGVRVGSEGLGGRHEGT